MDIGLGLFAASSWGYAYFAVKAATRHTDLFRVSFYTYFLGAIIIGCFALLSGDVNRLQASTTVWLWLLLASGLNLMGAVADFRAIQAGYLSIVTPITANYAAVTTALSILEGRPPSPIQFAGIALAIVAIVLITTATSSGRESGGDANLNGIAPAMLAALSFGSAYYIIGAAVVPTMGGIVPGMVTRVVAVGALILLARPLYGKFPPLPQRMAWGGIVGFAVGDSLASIASFVAYASGNISIVTTLAGLYTVVTVLLARIFLHEELVRQQWAGIGLAVFAVVLMGL